MAANPLPRLIAWALARRPVRAYLLYTGARGPMLADSVTYRTLFSVFAGVLLGFSVAALWLSGNAPAWQALVDAVDSTIPGLVGEGGLIDVSQIQAPAGLSIAGVISSIGLLGAAIGAIGSLRAAFRSIAGLTHDDVLWIWVLLRNLVLAIGIGAGLAAAAGATFVTTAGVGLVQDWLGIESGQPWVGVLTWLVSAAITFALDAAAVAVLFRMLSGVKAKTRTLLAGAAWGGVGLLVLQQLSGLFVGGANSNPLLTTFASLIALLLWLNLSSQVILLAGAYIVTGHEEELDRVRARHGATTLAQYRVRRAEIGITTAKDELDAARKAEAEERENASRAGNPSPKDAAAR